MKRYASACIVLLLAARLDAAERYWVGGTGNWSDDTNHWATSTGGAPAGGNLPSAADNCHFDSLSNATAYTTTVDVSATCLDFLEDAAPATSGVHTLAGSSALAVSGSMTLIAGMGRTYTGAITFNATSTGKTVTLAGVTLASAVTFNGAGGGWTLQDTYNTGTGGLTVSGGTLDWNSVTITAGSLTSGGATTRTITPGAATVSLSTTGNCVNFSGSNLTITSAGNTSTITCSGNGASFSGGGKTFYNVTMTGSGSTAIQGANSYNNFTRTGANEKVSYVRFSAGQTITGTLTLTGNSASNRLGVTSDTANVSRTLTAAAVSITDADFTDITGAGAATWSGTRLGNCLGNSGITFQTAAPIYWITGTGGNWSNTAKWSTTSGGSAGTAIPLCQDTATFDANSITSGSQTITFDEVRLSNVDFTAVTNTPVFNSNPPGSGTADVYATSLIFKGQTVTGGSSWNLWTRSSGVMTLATNGVSLGLTLLVQGYGTGTVRLVDSLTLTQNLLIYVGQFDARTNNANVTISTLSEGFTGVARGFSMGDGTTWTFTGSGTIFDLSGSGTVTITPGTSTIKVTNTSATNKTFLGGTSATGAGRTFGNIWFTGTGTGKLIVQSSNTFLDFKVDTAPKTVEFTAGRTTTVTTATMTGSAGNLITLQSGTAASAFTLTKAGGGTVCTLDYLSVKDSTASPASTWFAGANSTDVSGNTNWSFTACAAGGAVKTLMLMGVGDLR
jgi:hypothetical protein